MADSDSSAAWMSSAVADSDSSAAWMSYAYTASDCSLSFPILPVSSEISIADSDSSASWMLSAESYTASDCSLLLPIVSVSPDISMADSDSSASWMLLAEPNTASDCSLSLPIVSVPSEMSIAAGSFRVWRSSLWVLVGLLLLPFILVLFRIGELPILGKCRLFLDKYFLFLASVPCSVCSLLFSIFAMFSEMVTSLGGSRFLS